jgi:hypothetical protein
VDLSVMLWSGGRPVAADVPEPRAQEPEPPAATPPLPRMMP